MRIADDDVIVYNHIPKTAGTSVNHYFRNLLGREKVGWFGIDFGPDELAKGEGFERFKVIGGHFTRRQAKPIPGNKIFLSTIREPVARAISYHRFVMRQADHPMKRHLTGDLSADLLGKFTELTGNQQCAFLGEQATFASVIETRDAGRSHVVLSDDVGDLLHAVTRALGMAPIDIPLENVSPTNETASLTDEALRHFESAVAEDILLYRAIAGATPPASP